ncbi:hypothetical protein [Burkholderia ubonensis]|uniref:hypothetical protein n=1 Tax=Burkholderia ubonensis TaxID=101571 RepID=UPI0012FC46BF|nr:hypothetical protein [Burkholderia ubonensis]
MAATSKPETGSTQAPQTAGGLRQQDTRRRLADSDQRQGSMSFGNSSVSLIELHDMGATIDGKSIGVKSANVNQIGKSFIDKLQFNAAALDTYMKSVSPERADQVLTLLYEMASEKSPSAEPVLSDVAASRTSSSPVAQLDKLLNKMLVLKAKAAEPPPPGPKWVDRGKSAAAFRAGNSLQLYSIYAGVMGIRTSLQKGEFTDAAIDGAAIGAEVTSLLFEKGLEKTGQAILNNGEKIFNGFARTRVGMTLSRGAGLFANVFTLPFDIYGAVKSFNAAQNSSGKEVQDHYVAAAFNVTGATFSLLLGTSALAGFSSSGPIGIAAAAVLIVGAQVYSAARQVDDIDDYIELSSHERLRSGWFAFTGQAFDESVMDRFKVAKATSMYSEQLKNDAEQILYGEAGRAIEVVVNGNFDVQLTPVKHWKHQWDEHKGELPYIEVKETTVRERDDVVDAAKGLDKTMPGAVFKSNRSKSTIGGDTDVVDGNAIFWRLGSGNDQVTGAKDAPNLFEYGAGRKTLVGGEKDDIFSDQNAAARLKEKNSPNTGGVLNGGDGNDTLSLLGKVDPYSHYLYSGYDVDLKNGKLGLRSNSSGDAVTPHMTLTSIEHVETLEGASSRVTGTDAANRITLQGANDSVDAGAGNDVISITGRHATVNGGQGEDHYEIAQGRGTVEIIEDGKDVSHIVVGWNMESIQSWRVEGNDLVVESLRGVDGELPGREIRVANVYSKENGKRILKNEKLVFQTWDGYTVVPDLPPEFNDEQSREVKAVIHHYANGKPSPKIVSDGELPVSIENSSYLLKRGSTSTVLDVEKSKKGDPSTVYLDYDSSEIDKVEVNYDVQSKVGRGFTYLEYGEANLTLHFKDGKKVTLKNFAGNRAGNGSNVGGSIVASGFEMNRELVLTMRDGTSYRVQTPRHSYFDDRNQPGKKVVNGWGSLKLRNGAYTFYDPRVTQMPSETAPAPEAKPKLAATPQPHKIPDPENDKKYRLEGSALEYDIVLNGGEEVTLLTPGAQDGTSKASIWNLHTENLGDVKEGDIRFEGGGLWIGNVKVIYPPDDDPDKGLEEIRIVTRSGMYQADLSAEDVAPISNQNS